MLVQGDCLEVLPTLEANRFHSCVTDPPYHLAFMGKQWDRGDVAFRPETWAAVLRVLTPGAHLAAFGGSRTWHRMAVAIEDAGFEIRDTVCWLYGQGYPKSHPISKAIDKRLGKSGHVQPDGAAQKRMIPGADQNRSGSWVKDGGRIYQPGQYVPATAEAAFWSGWGTALKPAFEPIILARKPVAGSVAANVLSCGCGGLNIDGCRVPVADALGRWPANVAHDGSDEVMAALPDAPGAQRFVGAVHGNKDSVNCYGAYGPRADSPIRNDSGSAARFFYCAKADSEDRAGSKHPCIKPLDLMRWLTRLVTPPGGQVLDPFAGSGTTGEAARLEGFTCTLIENDAQSVADINRRLGRASGADTPLFACRASYR